MDPATGEISRRFVDPPPCLKEDTRRILMRENILTRQANSNRYMTMKRMVLLFNDIIIVAEIKNLGKQQKLIMKQTIFLDDPRTMLMSEEEVAVYTNLKHSFGITHDEKKLIFGCENRQMRKDWIKSIERSMRNCRNLKKFRGDRKYNEPSNKIHLNFPDSTQEIDKFISNGSDNKYNSRETDTLIQTEKKGESKTSNGHMGFKETMPIPASNTETSPRRSRYYEPRLDITSEGKDGRKSFIEYNKEIRTKRKQRNALMLPHDSNLHKARTVSTELVQLASDNITSHLNSLESIDETGKRAYQLEKNSLKFKKRSRTAKKKTFRENRRNMGLLIGIILATILFIIIIIWGTYHED